jgi:hypothetical protein
MRVERARIHAGVGKELRLSRWRICNGGAMEMFASGPERSLQEIGGQGASG